ncbi:MAG: HK97 gp10 family phage protein [Eubacterium sp.]|nr:HK97 gp10 family phage protein [Eubacterium sp.]
MAGFDVTMQGMDAVISKISNSPKRLHDTVLQKAREKAEKMVGIQKENCPVDTSILRESIHSFVEDNGDVISAGSRTNTSYAAYVEFGTGQAGDTETPKGYKAPGHPLDSELGIVRKTKWEGHKAQPFMYPGMKEVEPEIKEELGLSVQEVFGKI